MCVPLFETLGKGALGYIPDHSERLPGPLPQYPHGLHSPLAPPTNTPPLQACNRNNFVCVPLYETLGEDAIEYILDHSEARLVVVQGKRLGRVAKALKATRAGQVAAVVHFGGGESMEDVQVGGGTVVQC